MSKISKPNTWSTPLHPSEMPSIKAVNRPVWHLHPQESEVIKRIKTEGRIKLCTHQKPHKED